MKKLLVVFLCAVMLLSVVACDIKKQNPPPPPTATTTPAPKTAAELVEEAYAKLTPEKGVDVSVALTVTQGRTSMTETVDVKCVKNNIGAIDFYVAMSDGTVYLIGTTAYVEMQGEKYKMTATSEMLEDLGSLDMSNAEVEPAIMDALPATAPALVDGRYTVRFSLSGEDILVILTGLPYFGSDFDPDELEGVEFSACDCTLVIDADGNLVSEASVITFSGDAVEEEMTVTCVMTYHNPGSQVTVSAPADADEYVSLDAPSGSPAQMVQNAVAKITPEKGLDCEIVITSNENGVSNSITQTVKAVKKSDGTFDFVTKMTANGDSTTTTLVDGIVYIVMDGNKFKMTATADMLEDLGTVPISVDVNEAILNALPATAPALVEGKYVFSFTLTGDAIIAALRDHPIFSSMMDPDTIEDLTFSDYQGSIVIDSYGNLVLQTASFTVTSKNYPNESMRYTSVITYNDPGEQVIITAPADASSYLDLDAFQ